MIEVRDQITKARPKRFRRYPAYVDSGVEYLGGLPAHWSAKRLKLLAPVRTGKLGTKPEDVV